ncbi:17288_t:CDS:2 [Gigaspora margarita]|uniref:17288_t:CDS:1 n=1 Tax=Gigaspora margarita TaxID=4874 RepID=A0ABM8VYJ2_GIGMA|nr:17288_t:CDS:2 [Gigaspora margarita]
MEADYSVQLDPKKCSFYRKINQINEFENNKKNMYQMLNSKLMDNTEDKDIRTDISLSDRIDKLGNNIDRSHTNLIATEIVRLCEKVRHSLIGTIVIKL